MFRLQGAKLLKSVLAQPNTLISCRETHALAALVGETKMANWIFLGPPGVGKGTYAGRVADLVGIPHISTGDLVRAEIKSGSPLAEKMKEITSTGGLLPDALILDILHKRFEEGKGNNETGFLLDGFPRTAAQAAELMKVTDIHLVVNLSLREDVLIEKCCGRRVCEHCGKSYNIADIYRKAGPEGPEIIMPPLNPKPECADHLTHRADDTEEIVQKRLDIYNQEAGPVEDYFRQTGVLADFEITGGIPETKPVLLDFLHQQLSLQSSRGSKQ
ncbi:hypothetical protein CYMTET_10315 [Cymbomonas tetramitiformis]|uniref:adenylate kinase n=1 Tax=Cymbomonas tetramitiformis TaxID=36881 RepID=A0AAE0GPX4_9CHLO|nr:hypothetical protein CYMTET_10315 [Cymbomonas tetramitiformis]